jgi:hypothetical protein
MKLDKSKTRKAIEIIRYFKGESHRIKIQESPDGDAGKTTFKVPPAVNTYIQHKLFEDDKSAKRFHFFFDKDPDYRYTYEIINGKYYLHILRDDPTLSKRISTTDRNHVVVLTDKDLEVLENPSNPEKEKMYDLICKLAREGRSGLV